MGFLSHYDKHLDFLWHPHGRKAGWEDDWRFSLASFLVL
jgi:hypothetical protein